MSLDPLAPLAPVRPADRYTLAADLGVITCYFNSAGFASKRTNFARFLDSLSRSDITHRVVECAFADTPFELPESDHVLRIRARDVMWQKERLLNLAVAALPAVCTKVAWVDADILFAEANWAAETSRRLDDFPIVQPFDRVIRLPRGQTAYAGAGDAWPGFAAVYARHPNLMLGGDFARHGHTGFAWAARRDLLTRHGLYDGCISGSGDHMMAHAFCGDWSSPCIDRILGPATSDSPLRSHFVAWCRSLYKDVRARVGVTPGTILHLWHGDTENRRYVLRNQELANFNFDPATDLRIGRSGAWEWASDKPDLHRWAIDYYPSRREDG
jgi:hypothetical protein